MLSLIIWSVVGEGGSDDGTPGSMRGYILEGHAGTSSPSTADVTQVMYVQKPEHPRGEKLHQLTNGWAEITSRNSKSPTGGEAMRNVVHHVKRVVAVWW